MKYLYVYTYHQKIPGTEVKDEALTRLPSFVLSSQVYSRSAAPEMKRRVANFVAKNMLEHDVSPLVRRPRWATLQEVGLPSLYALPS